MAIHNVQHQYNFEGIEVLAEIVNVIAKNSCCYIDGNSKYDDDDNNNRNSKINKTKLMNKTKLSDAEVDGYLAVLSANGLISYYYPTRRDDDITYGITGKGMKFLEIYSYLDNYVPKRWMGDKKRK